MPKIVRDILAKRTALVDASPPEVANTAREALRLAATYAIAYTNTSVAATELIDVFESVAPLLLSGTILLNQDQVAGLKEAITKLAVAIGYGKA